MIVDKIENLAIYLPANIKDKILSFISNISPDTLDGEYTIIGDDVFMRIQSYPLKEAKFCKTEAHNQYIDIQSVISGAEGIDIFERDILTVKEPYDKENDVMFFIPACPYNVEIKENYFIVLFPHEAHRPQIETKEHKVVKKYVIKVKVDLWK